METHPIYTSVAHTACVAAVGTALTLAAFLAPGSLATLFGWGAFVFWTFAAGEASIWLYLRQRDATQEDAASA